MPKNGIVEVVVDGAHNENLGFPPLPGRKIRGELRFDRIPSHAAMTLVPTWGKSIPGQIIGYDPARKVGYIREPLRDDKHAELREKLAARFGCGFSPAVEEFQLATEDARATWAWWLVRSVEAGLCRVVEGELPDVNALPGTPRKRLFASQPDPQERLLEGILTMLQSQGQLLQALAGKIKA